MRNSPIYAAVLVALALAGCGDMGRLYPANPEANMTGPLEAHFTSVGTGHGGLVVMLPGRDVLEGTYAPAGKDFGNILAAAYGPQKAKSADEAASERVLSTTATLSGKQNLSMQCEFYDDYYRNHGYGACRSSTGALYTLKY